MTDPTLGLPTKFHALSVWDTDLQTRLGLLPHNINPDVIMRQHGLTIHIPFEEGKCT